MRGGTRDASLQLEDLMPAWSIGSRFGGMAAGLPGKAGKASSSGPAPSGPHLEAQPAVRVEPADLPHLVHPLRRGMAGGWAA